jgi:hypothetical protein
VAWVINVVTSYKYPMIRRFASRNFSSRLSPGVSECFSLNVISINACTLISILGQTSPKVVLSRRLRIKHGPDKISPGRNLTPDVKRGTQP